MQEACRYPQSLLIQESDVWAKVARGILPIVSLKAFTHARHVQWSWRLSHWRYLSQGPREPSVKSSHHIDLKR